MFAFIIQSRINFNVQNNIQVKDETFKNKLLQLLQDTIFKLMRRDTKTLIAAQTFAFKVGFFLLDDCLLDSIFQLSFPGWRNSCRIKNSAML